MGWVGAYALAATGWGPVGQIGFVLKDEHVSRTTGGVMRGTLRRKAAAGISIAMIALGVAGVAPATASRSHRAVVAASCRSGYVSATIDGQRKCLHAGEFCKHSADRQYRRYGFRCIRYYRNVNRYRLTHG